jgi:hypothetical protein
MSRRRRQAGLFFGATLVATMLLGSSTAFADQPPTGSAGSNLTADLDGRPLELANVGSYYCHDFAYPKIHCFSQPATLNAAVQPILAAGSSTYVVVFDYAFFAGPYMYLSQNYTVLALIGWNDRISSFIVENNHSGKFWTDWFYSGSYYFFCCNEQVASLGSYDNTFSSVYQY